MLSWKTYRVTYRFEGHERTYRLGADSRLPVPTLETELRRCAAFVETCLRSRFHDIELVAYDEVAC